MEAQRDWIEEPAAPGHVTICPPRAAAGHKKAKKRKGQQLRPCVRCKATVKFIRSKWAAHGQRRKGWHWVNEDGTHHRCSDFRPPVENRLDVEWIGAMERDNRPYDAEQAAHK